MLEKFFSQGIDDEFMVSQARAEACFFGTPEAARGTAPAPAARGIALSFMQKMVAMANIDMDRWYEMAALFDLYCLRSEKDAAELCESLPVLAAAIFRLVAKHDKQSDCVDGGSLEIGAMLEKVLAGRCCASVRPVSISAFSKMEMEVLKTVDWKVDMPTVHWWSKCFMSRACYFVEGRGTRHNTAMRLAFETGGVWLTKSQDGAVHLFSGPDCQNGKVFCLRDGQKTIKETFDKHLEEDLAAFSTAVVSKQKAPDRKMESDKPWRNNSKLTTLKRLLGVMSSLSAFAW
jgi:hypothetical protein